jgi:hypothetical protein
MHGIAELMPKPSLDFELITILFGVNSITLYYKGVGGIAAGVFHISLEGRVEKSCAHYTCDL